MERISLKIEGQFIKLDSLLKLSGLIDSGGLAKELIQDGQVLVNDQVCLQRGKKIRPEDRVVFDQYLIEVEGD
ncbi:MAG: RNA-binding S4 domain-containing protein [Tissierellia bacterium]|nr:RNA-binding S4 domain-containing protein [Tissierellia bacterium]